jgi:chaperonin GroES
MAYEYNEQESTKTEDKSEYTLEELARKDNIAEILDEEKLKKISAQVSDEFNEDQNSRKSYLDKLDKAMKLALQVYEMKSFPWQNASNVKYPLTSVAALQFHARAYPMLVPSKNILMTRVLGADSDGVKSSRAERVQRHMNYQIYDQMQGWEENHDRLLISLPITGCEFKKIYYDPEKDTNVSVWITSRDLVVNYFAKSLEDASRKTEILWLNKNVILSHIRAGLFLDCFEHINKITPSLTDIKQDRVNGTIPPKPDDGTPHMVLEWHGYLDLDEDGYKEPYIVTVHKDTQKVLRIVARYQPDAIERKNNEVVRIEADEYYHKYEFIPSPDASFYGIGFGTLVGPLNEAVNSIINQLVDAGSLNNLQCGFISKHLRIRGGSFQFQLGEWKQVNVAGQDIKSGIFPMPTKEPSATLYNLLQFLVASGERLTSTTDIMVGENPGQNQKATTTQAVVEQGQKVFTAIYKRIRQAMTMEFRKLYKLNSIYLDDREYYDFIAESDGMVDPSILRDDYVEGGFVILPTADPNAVSQMQKYEKLQAVGQLLSLGTIDPREYTKRYLDTLEIEKPETLIVQQQGPTMQEQAAQLQMQMAVDEHQTNKEVSLREQSRKEKETQLKAIKTTADIRESHDKLALDHMALGMDHADASHQRQHDLQKEEIKAEAAKEKAKQKPKTTSTK